LNRPLNRKFSRGLVFEPWNSPKVISCPLAPMPLGGTHVQQSFRSRRNTCAAVF
jgi:hypothetical protein